MIPNVFQIYAFVFCLDQYPAKAKPEKISQIAQNATKSAIPPNPLKKLKMSNNPNPEF